VKLRFAILLAVLTGCRTRAVDPAGPAETLKAYARALEEGRAVDGYRLLSDDAKRTVSLEAFERMIRESPDDVKELARALARPASPPVVSARVKAPSGEELDLVLENGVWTLDGLALDRYGQATPRQALLGFLRAYERQRFDVILRYVPDEEREGTAEGWASSKEALTADKLKAAWTGAQKEQLDAIVQAIRAALPTATIEETADRAALAYGAGGTVSFVRERGQWKLANLK